MAGDSDVAFRCVLHREWDRNGKSERICGDFQRMFLSFFGYAPSNHTPAEFAERLFKGSPLKAAPHKEFGCLNKISACFLLRFSLRGDVEEGAIGYVPIAFTLDSTEQLEFSLNSGFHKIRVNSTTAWIRCQSGWMLAPLFQPRAEF